MINIRALLLDGLANFIIFTPIVAFLAGVIIPHFLGTPKWSFPDQFVSYIITSIPIAFGLGAIFGRFLNFWRLKLGYK